ncbi:hypothetical protein LOTGIDRAFT_155178 [Lottia gigantea]|uniref:SRCR domain-containing protein n=1 Tax=Lottia gigantea TaxID=225164 RepID=V3ZMZ2_LOTGI|nr:hypothetical protein LOTGIDRAFT_155178 [Lottia gigantea]ESO85687.1 hypothetical protein LOTGIDRAFT_155178 [Lottia gigantea]
MVLLRWENYTILIANLTDPFKVVLIAHVPYGDSYIALDELFMSNCEKENLRGVKTIRQSPLKYLKRDALLKSGCLKDEFRCQSSLCISKDRICNLHHDCSDGEDESLTVCGMGPVHMVQPVPIG